MRSGLLIPLLLFVAVFALYAATAAPATLFGDPSEYQFIPAILGIAHPPGYAFYTLLAKLWQIAVPLGTIAFRTNLLAAALGAWGVTAVYLATWELGALTDPSLPPWRLIPPALLAALALAAAPDFWQHAIHANAHIVSAGLAMTHLWQLLRWRRTGRDRWLAIGALTLGWAIAHHPITWMGFPAYALFILLTWRPPRRARTLLGLAGCFLLGLAPLLYYPLRSPTAPFGPTNMRTWEGFIGHITAQGLRVNLFHFGLPDQPDRALVFWSLLRLQFPLPLILLIPLGLARIARRAPRPAALIFTFLAIHLLFTLNTVQDVMAYLLIPFAALAITIGAGALLLLQIANCKLQIANRKSQVAICYLLFAVCYLLFAVCYLLFAICFYQGALNLSRGISLRDFYDAERYVAAVHERFDGRREGAVLLSAWEQLTPLWVHAYTQGEPLDERDVKLVYVTAANPWVESIWQHIEEGPIYLADYRSAVRDAGFRLIPDGPFYRVIAPPATNVTPTHPLDVWVDGRVHLLGYALPRRAVRAGEPLELILYQSAPQPLEGIWMPYARLGALEFRWTTDSRLLTTQWQAGEIVAERYEIPTPPDLPMGEYDLRLGYADLSGGRAELPLSTGGTSLELVEIKAASPSPFRVAARGALANLNHEIALVGARARAGWQMRAAPWEKPLTARAGRALHLTLTWRALARPRDSYTVFIHLIDGAGRPVAGRDYTPLGGACPTYLWFPKWLPGQTLSDPYRLPIPADLPAGDYWLEVGMYGMTSLRRLPVVDLAGNLAGDRVILGPVRVE